MSFQEGLEGDRGRDRVQGCHLLKKVHTRNCSFKEKTENSASKLANCIILAIILYFYWQTLSNSLLILELG